MGGGGGGKGKVRDWFFFVFFLVFPPKNKIKVSKCSLTRNMVLLYVSYGVDGKFVV